MNLLIKSKGFTLIEILISLVILAISLLALASLMTVTTKNNAFGEHMTEAATFAQDKLEEFRVTSWDLISTGQDNSSIGSTGIQYDRNWVVRPNTDGNLKSIKITVKWDDGVKHSISILSTISN